jgi:hypothetical protein
MLPLCFHKIGDVAIRIARPGGIPASAFFSRHRQTLVDFVDVELDEEVLIFTGGIVLVGLMTASFPVWAQDCRTADQ